MEYCLVGEGSLPLDEMIQALRSINYKGFLSLEWDPQWRGTSTIRRSSSRTL